MRVRVVPFLLLLVFSAIDATAQTTFANVLGASGVAADKAGNVLVFGDKISSRTLLTFSPAGKKIGETLFGAWTTIGDGRLLYDSTGNIIYVFYAGNGGELYTFDAARKRFTKILTLSKTSFDTRQIVDVATGITDGFGGLVAPRFATWGDFAMFRQGTTLNFYFSAVYGATPFVVRVRLSGGRIQSARALIASRASTAGSGNAVRGITVTPGGTVLTTLPQNGTRGLGNYDRLIAFVEGTDGKLIWAKLSDAFISSRGMGVDPAGNLLIAQAPSNSSLCPFTQILVIGANGRTYRCAGGPVLMSSAIDVAASPDGKWAYVAGSATTPVVTGKVMKLPLR